MRLIAHRRSIKSNSGKSPRPCRGASRVLAACEPLESRVLLSAATLTADNWINAAGGDWDTAANWSAGVPTATSQVTINLTGTETITHATAANDSCSSITSNEPITLSAGTLNVATTIALTTNSLTLAGGTLRGGTITASGGVALVLSSSSGTLAGVTIAAGTVLDALQAYGAYAFVTGGLTVNGTTLLGGTANYGRLYFQGSQTLAGSGYVVLGASTANYLDAQGTGTTPTILTIASGITIYGSSGYIAGYNTGDSIVNNGTINGNVSGGVLYSNGDGSTGTVTNNGTIEINDTAYISQLLGTGNLTVGNGSSTNTVQLTAESAPDSFTNTQTSVTIGAGATLGITNNILLLNYGAGSTPLAAVRAAVADGAGVSGASNASGAIIISTAKVGVAGQYSVGYADATETGTVPSGNVELMYTLTGDSRMTGSVNFMDYSVMQNSYNQTGRDWAQGDWDQNGTVNFLDYSLLQNNYNQSVPAAVTAAKIVNRAGTGAAMMPLPATSLHEEDLLAGPGVVGGGCPGVFAVSGAKGLKV